MLKDLLLLEEIEFHLNQKLKKMMMNKIIDMLKNDVVFGLIFIPS